MVQVNLGITRLLHRTQKIQRAKRDHLIHWWNLAWVLTAGGKGSWGELCPIRLGIWVDSSEIRREIECRKLKKKSINVHDSYDHSHGHLKPVSFIRTLNPELCMCPSSWLVRLSVDFSKSSAFRSGNYTAQCSQLFALRCPRWPVYSECHVQGKHATSTLSL